jgi:predicted RNA-binding protein with PUA-like domain
VLLSKGVLMYIYYTQIIVMNYWIFQGKPAAYKFDSAIEKSVLKEWNVKQHITKIRKGDKAIIWLCGENPGCYGVVDILTNPELTGVSADNHEWNTADKTGRKHQREDETVEKVKIEFIYNLFEKDKFIWKDKIPMTNGALATLRLKGFIQGKTNMVSTREQFDMIVELVERRAN